MPTKSNSVELVFQGHSSIVHRYRWLALAVLCLGVLMIMLDSTIVNVALPSIQIALQFPDTSLAWVVNAYFLTFGGFLLLGGRLGDLYGRRRLFLFGIALFTIASLVCGVAQTPVFLVSARAMQGFGGAIVTAVAMSLIMDLFGEPADRAKAMGVYGFVCASGSSLGAVLGGALTGSLGWHWIFLINLPIGIAVIALSLKLLPGKHERPSSQHLDTLGAVTGTASLMLAVYAIVNGNEWGWASYQSLGYIAVASVLFVFFLAVEMRVKMPLLPLRLFRLRNVTVANIVVIFWAGALFAWFFLSSLYLQLVLGYEPMQVGLAFLPANLIMAAFSLWISGPLVNRFGIKWPLVVGMFLASVGLLLFSRAPVDGSFSLDVLPGMLLFGLGAGIAVNPMLLAATNGVPATESGLASGVVNTSFAMGGALWLAVLTSFAAYYTKYMETIGLDPHAALNGGYQAAFLAAACFALLGAVLSAMLLKV